MAMLGWEKAPFVNCRGIVDSLRDSGGDLDLLGRGNVIYFNYQ
jgi:hypothetical protein